MRTTVFVIAAMLAIPGDAAAPKTYTRIEMGYAFSCGMIAGAIQMLVNMEVPELEARTKEMRGVFVDTGCEPVEKMFRELRDGGGK